MAETETRPAMPREGEERMTEEIRTMCPDCGQDIVIPMDWYVGRVVCPFCEKHIKAFIILKVEETE